MTRPNTGSRVTPTRRRFLQMVGGAGGAIAVHNAMEGMGLIPTAAKAVTPPNLPTNSGQGTRIAILGAGIAGMTAAYELNKAGYDCTILEAQDHGGGRCWSVRRGTVIQETNQRQVCGFDDAESLYFNPGPARIPYHHQGILGYCKAFGVPMEVIVNENRAAYFQNDGAFGGEAVLNRRVVNDSRGYIAELLAKAINQNALDQELTLADKEQMLSFVRSFGNLSSDYAYGGSSRAGYQTPPGATLQVGERNEPLEFAELLKSDFWRYKMHFGEGFHQAATMLQPVGGMDQIAKGFERQVGHLIEYNAVVRQIRKTSQGVRVVYADGRGREQALDADFAICTFPLKVLAGIDADFSPAFKTAIATCDYVSAAKVAFQCDCRFWEEDSQIYGGISWTDQDITQIWYPSGGFHGQKGVVVGAYIWDNDIGDPFAEMTLEQRLDKAIAEGSRVHPTYADEVGRATGMSIAWSKMPYSLGGWAEWSEEARATAYPLLIEPDGPIYLAGEHLSHITGWQEGAVVSAHHVVEAIATRTQPT